MSFIKSLEDLLKEAGQVLDELRELVPKNVDPTLFDSANPLALRLAISRGGHLNRILDLAETSFSLVEDHRPLPALVVARACLESSAVLTELAERAEKYSEDSDEDAFNAFLERATLGSKNNETPFESTNILTYIDKLEKKFPGVKEFYFDLCEQAHPNWAATAPYFEAIGSSTVNFVAPGREFEKLVPMPIFVATKIAIDAAARLGSVDIGVGAEDT